jgi:hypothetical protein
MGLAVAAAALLGLGIAVIIDREVCANFMPTSFKSSSP